MALHDLFLRHGTDKAAHGYAPWYEHYLDPKRVGALLEIGVAKGASLRAWREWLPWAEIHGIDRNPDTPEVDGCVVHRSDVCDWRSPTRFDVVIDDGSHLRVDIEDAVFRLWPSLRPGGWYVVEDLAANAYRGGVELFARPDAAEVHRHGEIVFARKA